MFVEVCNYQFMDINDSSFTIVVTIIASLMGLSYPLLLQCIQRIDEKYKSILLVRMFKQEKAYKCYLIFLITTFITVIYLPFAPECKCEAIMDYFLVKNSAALLGLQISSSHIILLMGVYLGNYQNIYGDVRLEEKEGYYLYKRIKIYSISSEHTSILVLRQEDLPFVYFKPLKDFTLVNPNDLLNDSTQLYCNIQSDSSETPNKDKVSLFLNAYIHYNEKLRYVRLNIMYQLSDEGNDNFDEIQPINKFIV